MQILALNCRLQVEQVNVMEAAGGQLVLVLHSLRFFSPPQIFYFFIEQVNVMEAAGGQLVLALHSLRFFFTSTDFLFFHRELLLC